MKSIHDMQFWGFLFSNNRRHALKRGEEESWKNGVCRNYFIKQSLCHTFPVILKARNYRECMETKKKKNNIYELQRIDAKSSSSQW